MKSKIQTEVGVRMNIPIGNKQKPEVSAFVGINSGRHHGEVSAGYNQINRGYVEARYDYDYKINDTHSKAIGGSIRYSQNNKFDGSLDHKVKHRYGEQTTSLGYSNSNGPYIRADHTIPYTRDRAGFQVSKNGPAYFAKKSDW